MLVSCTRECMHYFLAACFTGVRHKFLYPSLPISLLSFGGEKGYQRLKTENGSLSILRLID